MISSYFQGCCNLQCMSSDTLKSSPICSHSFWVRSNDNFWSLLVPSRHWLENNIERTFTKWTSAFGRISITWGIFERSLKLKKKASRSFQNYILLGRQKILKQRGLFRQVECVGWCGQGRSCNQKKWDAHPTCMYTNKELLRGPAWWGETQTLFLGDQHNKVPLWSDIH